MSEKRKTVTKYMHTLGWQPATFYEQDRMIAYAGGRAPAELCDSLAQIRREQRAHMRWCDRNFVEYEPEEHGYILVRVRV